MYGLMHIIENSSSLVPSKLLCCHVYPTQNLVLNPILFSIKIYSVFRLSLEKKIQSGPSDSDGLCEKVST